MLVKTVSILPATGIDRCYTYAVVQDVVPAIGSYVRISLGRQEAVGVIWDDVVDHDIPVKKLKDVTEIFDVPPLSDSMRRYIEKIAQWTMSPRGLILKMVVPSVKLLETPKKPLSYICRTISHTHGITLSEAQNRAADTLKHAVTGQKFAAVLLDGVTGSGKTEVFFEAVSQAIHEGKQALIMMPEIALTDGFVARFENHFGVKAALWHSHMTPRQRQTVWQGVVRGVTKAVIGARSSLFLPYADLGVIVVDEEHDSSYKQEDNVIYHARDMAVLRGYSFGHPVILASATPSLETLWNVRAR